MQRPWRSRSVTACLRLIEPITQRPRPANRRKTCRRPAFGVKPSVPRQLVLARAALINKNQYAARGLMEEAQTLIVFQPATTTARLSTVAASQLTEALVMLGNGNDAGALQCLDQAIAAIRPDVLAVAN